MKISYLVVGMLFCLGVLALLAAPRPSTPDVERDYQVGSQATDGTKSIDGGSRPAASPHSNDATEGSALVNVEAQELREAVASDADLAHGPAPSDMSPLSTEETWPVVLHSVGDFSPGSTVRVSGLKSEDRSGSGAAATWEGPMEEAGTAEAELAPGAYVAALFNEESGLGPLTEFIVVDQGLTVPVPAWSPFDVVFQLRDGYTGEAVPQGYVEFTATAATPAWADARRRTAVSDESGLVRLSKVQPGEWDLLAVADGYTENGRTYQLPGAWAPDEEHPDEVNLQWFPIPPTTALRVQLVGDSEWNDHAQFEVSHTHEGEKVRFDARGFAELSLGWYDEPLYLKLWYPDGRAAISYLEDGLPEDGKPHPIEIGGDRRLEIDLRFAPGFREAIEGFDSAAIRVSFRPKTGDAMFVGKETFEEGVFVFETVQASEAIVNFATSKPGGGAVDWKTQWVDLKPAGTTSCTLLVDQRPVTLTFVDANDHAVPQYNFELRQLPNTTSWLAGGMCDENGQSDVARVLDHDCVLVGWVGDPARFEAYDLPVEFPLQGDSLRIPVGETTPTHLEVLVGGRPRGDVEVQLRTGVTDLLMLTERTDANGQLPTVDLVNGSQLDAVLTDSALWARVPAIRLQPGQNSLMCFPMGQLTFSSRGSAHRVQSDGFGEALSEWLELGVVSWVKAKNGVETVAVPVGSYTVDSGLATERTIVVGEGKVTHAGL